MTAYKDDLVYIHVVGFGHFAEGATPGLLEILRQRGLTEGLAKLICRAFGRKPGEGVSARYDGSGDQTDEGQYLLLDVSEESPGTYVLAVRVTDQVTGEEVQAQRRVILE